MCYMNVGVGLLGVWMFKRGTGRVGERRELGTARVNQSAVYVESAIKEPVTRV